MRTPFELAHLRFLDDVMRRGREVEVGEWQSQSVRDNPDMISRELTHQRFEMEIPARIDDLQDLVKPNLPWAEDHFKERVSGKPLNPPPSEAWWPYARANNAEHKVEGEKFHHTYPERIWPKYAEKREYEMRNTGIRYDYGDLMDVVKQLQRNPLTRQAYLPIWFPEDTGAAGVDGQRVPCTLGYHFLLRPWQYDIVYYIRSCDLLRHFTDDVYMAARLLQWVVAHIMELPGRPMKLYMHISSLHIFRGDYPMVKQRLQDWFDEEEPEYGAAV